jgi:hypothetical protein
VVVDEHNHVVVIQHKHVIELAGGVGGQRASAAVVECADGCEWVSEAWVSEWRLQEQMLST